MKLCVRKSFIGEVSILAATVIWGSSFFILKNAISEFPLYFVLFLRFGVSAFFLFLVHFKKVIKTDRKTLMRGVFLGLILTAAYGLQTLGLQYTTPSKNAFLSVTYVIAVPFIAWIIYREKPHISNAISAVICFIGIGLICLNGFSSLNIGDILTVACGIFYALQMVFNDKFVDKENVSQLLTIELAVTGFIFGILSVSLEIPAYPKSISLNQVLIFAYLIFVCTCLTQFLQLFGQRFTTSTVCALLLSMEAVFGTLFSVLFAGDEVSVQLLIGFLLVFAALIISETKLSFIIEPIKRKIKKKRDKKVIPPADDNESHQV